jgi:ATP-binding cassette subfamily C (CFTR/MRP) protein 4
LDNLLVLRIILFLVYYIIFKLKYFYRVNLEEHVFYHDNNSLKNNTLRETPYNNNATNYKISDTLLWWTISRQTCIIVFVVFTFSMILAILIRTAIFVSVCMKSSINLHNNMFNAIVRATMYFFNTNSSGNYNFE